MAKAKRPRKKPDVSKGPQQVRSGWPKDNRPPRRGGKSGSPLATGNAQRLNTGKANPSPAPAKGTSIGGKPVNGSDLSAIPSTETPRGKKPPIAAPSTKPRRLNERELRERDKRFREAFGKKRRLEKEKKRVTADLSSEIKELAKECDQLHDELESGYEQLKQGELPLEAAEENAGASTPKITDESADDALAKIAAAAGETPSNGNGAPKVCETCGSSDPAKHPWAESDPTDRCDDAFHDAAPRAGGDDLGRAMAAETAGAPV